jgi:hypothetical protein
MPLVVALVGSPLGTTARRGRKSANQGAVAISPLRMKGPSGGIPFQKLTRAGLFAVRTDDRLFLLAW